MNQDITKFKILYEFNHFSIGLKDDILPILLFDIYFENDEHTGPNKDDTNQYRLYSTLDHNHLEIINKYYSDIKAIDYLYDSEREKYWDSFPDYEKLITIVTKNNCAMVPQYLIEYNDLQDWSKTYNDLTNLV